MYDGTIGFAIHTVDDTIGASVHINIPNTQEAHENSRSWRREQKPPQATTGPRSGQGPWSDGRPKIAEDGFQMSYRAVVNHALVEKTRKS